MNAVHRSVIRVTGGRLGWAGGGMPMLELTTLGRTTGHQRVTMLSSPLQMEDTIVVVALGGGGARHPAWYLNLLAVPEVTVRWQGGPPAAMLASVADDDLRAQLWSRITTAFPDYATWQEETERQLPVVLLDPMR